MVIALLILIALLLGVIAYQVGRMMPAILEALEDLLKAQLDLRAHQSSIARRPVGVAPVKVRPKVAQAYSDELQMLGGRQSQGLSLVKKGGPNDSDTKGD